MKRDYNVFTKQELVDFLAKYEDNFLYLDKPFDIMMEQKMDAVSKQLDVNLKESEQLNAAYKSTGDKWQYLSKSQELHEQWKKLDREYERLSKLRFGTTQTKYKES